MQSSNFVEARVKIKNNIPTMEYLLLYILLFLPLPKSISLRVVER